MFRAEATAGMRRWAETAAVLVVGGFASWMCLRLGLAGGWLGWLGLTVVGPLSAVWFRIALRRARIGGAGLGPGVVMVEEGRISYFGPFGGAFIDVADLTSAQISRARDGRSFWRLTQSVGEPVLIPANARGAERLLDALTPLPGFDADRAAALLASGGARAGGQANARTGALTGAGGGAEAAATTIWRRTR